MPPVFTTAPVVLLGGRDGPFCSPHHCNWNCCGKCKKSLRPDGKTARPHLLYLHIEKTGGSSLECATAQTLTPQGLWSNMGHTSERAVAACLKACTMDDVRPQIVLTVRDPYAHIRSAYTYAWSCVYSDWCRYASGPATLPHDRLPKTNDCIRMRRNNWRPTFLEFVRNSVAPGLTITQTSSIHRACGANCHYDHVLHTENLASDWAALSSRLELPLVTLPRVNEDVGIGPHGPPPPTVFDEEIVGIIDRVEAQMFDRFGYKRRSAPFELKSLQHQAR